MFKVLATLLLTVGLALGYAIDGDVSFEVCKSADLATIIRFSVSECPTGSDSCEFTMGKEYTFELEGKIHHDHPAAAALPFKVVATVLGFPVVLAEGDGCETIACPITPGQDVTFKITKTIPNDLPLLENVSVSARFWADKVGTNAKASACASIKVSIVKP